jgi:flavodoxin
MKSCLVAFYSRTGITRKVAYEIAQKYQCDLEEIQDVAPRAGMFGYLHSGYEAMTKKLPSIQTSHKDPGDYALTILGTPVWAGNIAAPMRTYIEQNKLHLNRVAAFCTMGGSGGNKVLDEIGLLCGQKPVMTFALTDKQIEIHQYSENINRFAQALTQENA